MEDVSENLDYALALADEYFNDPLGADELEFVTSIKLRCMLSIATSLEIISRKGM